MPTVAPKVPCTVIPNWEYYRNQEYDPYDPAGTNPVQNLPLNLAHYLIPGIPS